MGATMVHRGSRVFVVSASIFILLLFAGCGSGSATRPASGSSPAAEEASFPVTIEADNGSVEISAEPRSIVSLSPTATEMLFAIGAGDQVVAVDDQSDFPADVPTTDLSGFEPNVEAIAGYEPDLVVYSTDPGDLQKSLEKIGITAIQHDAPAALDGAYEQIEELGRATGHPEEAEGLILEMQTEIEELVDSLPEASGLSYYHELDPTYFTATEDSFIGTLYDEAGLSNIAEGVKGASAGYVQLSEEHIIDSDPDLIFLADSECCDQSPDTVAKRPGWNNVAAVDAGHVFEIPDDVASRWGPRVVDFLAIVVGAVNEVAP